MFTRTVPVPRITSKDIDSMEVIVKSLSQFVHIPTIADEVEAVTFAQRNVKASLATSEYVAGVKDVTETASGWDVELIIFGD